MKLYKYQPRWSPYSTGIRAKSVKHFWECIAETYKDILKGKNAKDYITRYN